MGILVEHAHKVAIRAMSCMHIAHCELVRRARDYGGGIYSATTSSSRGIYLAW